MCVYANKCTLNIGYDTAFIPTPVFSHGIYFFRQNTSLWRAVINFSNTHLAKFPFSHCSATYMWPTCENPSSHHLHDLWNKKIQGFLSEGAWPQNCGEWRWGYGQQRWLGGPRRHWLPLPTIMNSSKGMLYTFFLGGAILLLLTTTPGSPLSVPSHSTLWEQRPGVCWGGQVGKKHKGKRLRAVGLGQIMNKRGNWLTFPSSLPALSY